MGKQVWTRFEQCSKPLLVDHYMSVMLSNILGIVLIHEGESRYQAVFSGTTQGFFRDAFLQEAFGAGDTLQCRVSRSRSGDLTVSYQKNGVELGKAFEMQASPMGAQGFVCKTGEHWDHPIVNHYFHDLVGGLEHSSCSISYMGCHPSHWLSHIFQDG